MAITENYPYIGHKMSLLYVFWGGRYCKKVSPTSLEPNYVIRVELAAFAAYSIRNIRGKHSETDHLKSPENTVQSNCIKKIIQVVFILRHELQILKNYQNPWVFKREIFE